MFLANVSEVRIAFFDGELITLNNLALPAFVPWYICEVSEFEKESGKLACITTHLISDIKNLTDFVESRKINRTYMVSPGHLLNKDNWSLIRIKSISQANYTDENYKSSVYRFETDTGEFIDHDVSGLNEGKYKLEFKTILQFD